MCRSRQYMSGMLIASLLAVPGIATADLVQEVRQCGNQFYLVTQVEVPSGMTRCVDGGFGRCAHVVRVNKPDGGYALELRQFSRWGVSLHSPQVVRNGYLYDALTACTSEDTWTCWSEAPSCMFRRYASNGQALSPALELYPPADVDPESMAVSPTRVAVVIADSEQSSDGMSPRGVHRDLYARLFTRDGVPLADPIVVSDHPYPFSENGWATIALEDDTFVVCYVEDNRDSIEDYAYLRRIESDLSVSDPVQVSTIQCKWAFTQVLEDGTFMVYLHERISDQAYMRHFSAALEPLGPPVLVGTAGGFAGAPDGRFVVYRTTDDYFPQVLVELHDSDGQPLCEAFSPTIEPVPYTRALGNPHKAGAYTADGTICLAWVAYDSIGAGEYISIITPFEPGDMNYDGLVNNFDIDPFVLALTDPEEYQQLYPELPYQFLGDLNFDGDFNNFDIDPFVDALTAP